ncbi:MAG: hypothetical protein JEZ02_20605 [Desulfatibacillum sp.]|nr:hypothetical protein [Desulfatibacillum sp.]
MSHHHHDHDHEHDHDHDHEHGHDHSHGHSHDTVSPMNTREKLQKLLEHWVAHNQDHAKTYETWASRAEGDGYPEVAALLRQAGTMNLDINKIFQEAAAKLK